VSRVCVQTEKSWYFKKCRMYNRP